MLTPNFNDAYGYVKILTGNAESVMDFKCIHDTNKAVPAHNFRGTLREQWETLCRYNQNGYGVFAFINAMNGEVTAPRTLENVEYIRAHCIDLDNMGAQANYERATQMQPAPTFAVQTSPGKFHVYWCVQPYRSNEFYTLHQRKLRQLFDGDKNVIDATRVLRVPGFYHQKAEPFMVRGWGLSGVPTTAEILQAALAPVNAIDHFSSRYPLGDAEMAAPSLDWLRFALTLLDPNTLDRSEWVSLSAAIKQAGWTFTDEATLRGIWEQWCALYKGNDAGENLKLWNSIRDTEVGWPSIERRSTVKAYMMFGHKDPSLLMPHAQGAGNPTVAQETVAPVQQPAQNAPQAQPRPFGEILDPTDCSVWFRDCHFISSMGKIFSPSGRFMDSVKFNGTYGGKHFIITSTGKTTNEAWTAALKSTCWTIPKVDHTRFLPSEKPYSVVEDELGRLGINTYVPARVHMQQGDVSLFLDWLNRILPNQGDQYLFLSYMAHCIKYPGFKIPWCPLLQGAKGIGKTVIEEVMTYALGAMYVYTPPAPELVKSGSTFNSWMKNKLMIFVDEIKIDERRELAEILKPLISQHRVQMQSKGVDQEMEDNPANWISFSNFKDAIPIDEDERRYAIFFSALQTAAEIIAAGMDKNYFVRLWKWLREENGKAAITHYLYNFPIEKGGLDIRAPKTSSYDEAIRISRSPMEIIIRDCVADGMPGFRGGYVSTLAILSRVKAAGVRTPSSRSVETCLEKMGYIMLGRAPRAYAQEDVSNRTNVFALMSNMDVNQFGFAQGYE